MSKLLTNLKLLTYLKEIEIYQKEKDYYEIYLKDSHDYDESYYDIRATINVTTGDIEYDVTETYNCGQDFITIDMKKLNKLQTIVKELIGD